MIPKIIHYCWFGGNTIPESVRKCIASWEKYCPNYKIIEWNEENYNIQDKCQFVRDAYANQKWAFVSDYARLDVVHQYGGVYLDTDVELIKPLDKLIENGRGYFGFENENTIATGLGFSCEKGEPILLEMMDCYKKMEFNVDNLSDIKCPIINTEVLESHGVHLNNSYQEIKGIKILPTDYLCPENIFTGKKEYTLNTISIHHYTASWTSEKERKRMNNIIKVKSIIPSWLTKGIQKIYRETH